MAAFIWATLVAVSTLFTEQRYVVDVVSGALIAGASYLVFLRTYPRSAVPQLDARAVPPIMLGFVGIHALAIAGFWVAYLMGCQP